MAKQTVMRFLTAKQVLFLHARLIAETGGSHGVRDLGLLQSAIGRPQARFEGTDPYLDLYIKAAALLDSLVRNHPFVDGNKRTALVAAALFTQRNGCRLTASNKEIATFTLAVAPGAVTLEAITHWLQQHATPG